MEPVLKSRSRPALDAGAPLRARLAAFAAERHPFAMRSILLAFDAVSGAKLSSDETSIEALRAPFGEMLGRALTDAAPEATPDTTPGVSAAERLRGARADPFEWHVAPLSSLAPENPLPSAPGTVGIVLYSGRSGGGVGARGRVSGCSAST